MHDPSPPDTYPSSRYLFFVQWLVLLVMLLLLGSFLVWTLHNEHRNLTEREQQNLANSAKVIHDNLGRQLEAINKALTSVLNNLKDAPAVGRPLDNESNKLRELTDAMTGVRTMNILDAQGTVLASNRQDLIGKNLVLRRCEWNSSRT